MRLTDPSFEEAVERYGDTVFRLAYSYLKNRADAEDVMQTVMLKLFEYDKEFESEAHLKHWLRGCRSMRAGSSCAPSGGAFPSLWMTGASWRHRNMGSGQSCWRL